MGQVQLLTADAALGFFSKKLLEKKELIEGVIPLNENRHFLITCRENLDGKQRYYLVYHKDFFQTFTKQFPNFVIQRPEYINDVGESLNKEWLDFAIREAEMDDNLKLIFIYPTGNLLWIYPSLFKKFADTSGLMRSQKRMNFKDNEDYTGTQTPVFETTYSIPFSLLRKFE